MSEIQIACAYCSPPTMLLAADPHQEQSMEAFKAAWKAAAASFGRIQCEGCGSAYCFEDDGVPADEGGSITRVNASAPKITGINVASGPRTGGTTVFISGQALDIGDLVVKFGGRTATAVAERTDTSARVTLPPAVYTLNVVGTARKYTTTPVLGSLIENEPVVSPAGTTGIVWKISGNYHWLNIVTFAEGEEDLTGVSFTGSTSGAIVTVASVGDALLSPGEFVYGLTSVAQGVCRTHHPLIVDAPSAGFAPNDYVKGSVSEVLVKLSGSPAYSGLVDITVENEHGQRATGGTLVGAFTYA